MVQAKRKARVVLRTAVTGDGYYTIQFCVDQWKTVPYRWASREACEMDIPHVMQKLAEAGYEVVKPEKGEVAIV
jgi:hypothetical protein